MLLALAISASVFSFFKTSSTSLLLYLALYFVRFVLIFYPNFFSKYYLYWNKIASIYCLNFLGYYNPELRDYKLKILFLIFTIEIKDLKNYNVLQGNYCSRELLWVLQALGYNLK